MNPDPNALAAQLDASMDSAPATAMSYFMKINQTTTPGIDPALFGQMTYGPDNLLVTPDMQWIVMVDAMEHGFLLRREAEVNQESYSSIFQPLPKIAELPQPPHGYKYCYAISMKLAINQTPSFAVTYAGDQQGFIEMMKKTILPAIRARLADPQAAAEQSWHPIVSFQVTSYESKNGIKYKPVCTILGWTGAVAVLEAPSETHDQGHQMQATPQLTQQPAQPVPAAPVAAPVATQAPAPAQVAPAPAQAAPVAPVQPAPAAPVQAAPAAPVQTAPAAPAQTVPATPQQVPPLTPTAPAAPVQAAPVAEVPPAAPVAAPVATQAPAPAPGTVRTRVRMQ